MLSRKFSKASVTQDLTFGKSAVAKFTNSAGIEQGLTLAVETLTATNSVPASKSGTTYLLNSATEFVTTLPAPALGLRYTFIVAAAPVGANYTVVTNGSANIIAGFATNAAGALVTPLGDGDTISFVASQSVAGDQVTVVSDGTSWFMSGFAQVAAGITNTKAS